MIDKSRLKDLLAAKEYNRLEKVLICLAVDSDTPKQVRDLKALATSSGLRAAQKWNFSAILGGSKGLAVRTDDGWELTTDGRKVIADIVGPSAYSGVPIIASSLRQHLPNISNPDTKSFLEEAIECYENGQLRAAVVLSWVGAISVLHNHVVSAKLSEFNAEAARRDSRWKPAKNSDDLGKMKEFDFLNILEALSVIGKNVKQELEGCLRLRNSCGHPNSLEIGESKVSAHVEVLLLNIFSKFSA
ncbi:hypothetical protein [Thioalkalivibrio sp. ALJ1]|uniref:hypothetical protein n=1 Tax=Thioalkalivibrio sp. ALJ1 TaxID=1158144 RepID=UPI001AD8098A|nr:hypothetical protein [Thioalkalivibrio sp. ALJ1]